MVSWLRTIIDIATTLVGVGGIYTSIRAWSLWRGWWQLIEERNAAEERASRAESVAQQYMLSAELWERRYRDLERDRQ